ncbi:MAG: FHA domain-containing protein [Cyanobacteria bacterium P01_A01_bin.135]
MTEEPIDVWTFEGKPHIRIGRAADNDIVLANSRVSRHHIDIKHVFGIWKLENVGINGMTVDGQQVKLAWINNHGLEVHVGQLGPILKFWPDSCQESVIDAPDSLEKTTLHEQPFA